jgi:hypothetical protein
MDGRPTVDVWRETTGCTPDEIVHQSHLAAWAMGVESTGTTGDVERVIRGAFGFDLASGAVILQAAIPEGSRVMLQHRTAEKVLNGTQTMGKDLAARLAANRPWAVLGWECGARTYPFLGEANTRKEHEELRAAVSPDAPWIGMMAWGEIGPCAGLPAFHNYTYPLLVLTDSAS